MSCNQNKLALTVCFTEPNKNYFTSKFKLKIPDFLNCYLKTFKYLDMVSEKNDDDGSSKAKEPAP